MGQLELQKYMMEELLGIKADFVFLVSRKQKKRDSHAEMTWQQAFESLDLTGLPPFVDQTLRCMFR